MQLFGSFRRPSGLISFLCLALSLVNLCLAAPLPAHPSDHALAKRALVDDPTSADSIYAWLSAQKGISFDKVVFYSSGEVGAPMAQNFAENPANKAAGYTYFYEIFDSSWLQKVNPQVYAEMNAMKDDDPAKGEKLQTIIKACSVALGRAAVGTVDNPATLKSFNTLNPSSTSYWNDEFEEIKKNIAKGLVRMVDIMQDNTVDPNAVVATRDGTGKITQLSAGGCTKRDGSCTKTTAKLTTTTTTEDPTTPDSSPDAPTAPDTAPEDPNTESTDPNDPNNPKNNPKNKPTTTVKAPPTERDEPAE